MRAWRGRRGQSGGSAAVPFDAKCRRQLSPVDTGQFACGIMFYAINWACLLVLRLPLPRLPFSLSLSVLSLVACLSVCLPASAWLPVDLYLIVAADNVCNFCNRLPSH